MIISNNKSSDIALFNAIMKKTDDLLNNDARARESYYEKRNGKLLEEDVYKALCIASSNTEFDGTIRLVSGASFPDIVAGKYYGVEVKSTVKNHWTSIGSSILESTRDKNVERIFLTFGKLGKPVSFISRPYEECLSGIAVTHYPRYKIDMTLKRGETIFDKMGIPYDTIRKMDNPVAPVSKYYTEHAKPGESLWWAQGEVESTTETATIRLWTSLSKEEKERMTAHGYALFPEVLSAGNNKKYNRYALWLASNQGVVNTNIRDSFSAGGKRPMALANHLVILVPAAFARIKEYKELIRTAISDADPLALKQYWATDYLESNRIDQWCKLVINYTPKKLRTTADDILSTIFSEHTRIQRYSHNGQHTVDTAGFAIAEGKYSRKPSQDTNEPNDNDSKS